MQMSLASGTRSDALGRCHVCGAKVVVKSAGEVVIKNAILKVDGASGRVTAKCSHCKAWVAVPLGLDAFLGAATWLDAHTLLVAGAHGLVATHTF